MDNGVEEGNIYSSLGECLGIIISLKNLEMFNPIANQVNADKKDILLYISWQFLLAKTQFFQRYNKQTHYCATAMSIN